MPLNVCREMEEPVILPMNVLCEVSVLSVFSVVKTLDQNLGINRRIRGRHASRNAVMDGRILRDFD